MKSFIAFWKKDIINKSIVLAVLALAGGLLGIVILISTMPQGKSLQAAFADFIPARVTPTFDINSYLTPSANIPVFTTATPVPVTQAAATLPPPTLTIELPTPTLELLPTLVLELPTQPLENPTQSNSNAKECIPNNLRQTGRVVEILDGNTVRVLIEKLVYVVRYIGVTAPEDKIYSEKARIENSKLVYGEDITLIADVSDKDSRGRLLRYILKGNTFINLIIIQQGFGTALNVSPNSACAQTFKQAEQSASTSILGVWGLTATPNSP